MLDDVRIEDCLDAWEEARALGKAVDLTELCRDVPELLDELKRRVGELEALDCFLGVNSSTRSERPGQETTQNAGSAGTSWTPFSIGRYAVQSILGEGTFGTVYLARDTELDRLVALKVPRRGRFRFATDQAQFIAEARTAAQLRHAGIVAVHDVDRQADGTPLLVLEYIHGSSLKAVLDAGRLSARQAAQLMAEIADAVAEAHRKGFVHRDLKPANILVDDQFHPHVADFGLAVHESAQRKHAGEFSGTISYMSPEQIRGEVHRLDGRADVWALGVILYQMLVGRVPFTGTTAHEVSDEIEHRDPRPPRQIDPSLPPELERIVFKCCQKKATDRYSNAVDLSADLHAWLDGASASASPTVAPSALAKQPQPINSSGRRANMTWFVTGALGGLVLLVLYFKGMLPVARPQVTPAADPRTGDATTNNPAIPSLSKAPEQVQVQLHVQRAGQTTGYEVLDTNRAPLRTGDKVQIHATSSQPAYMYVYWYDAQGKPQRVWPESAGRQVAVRSVQSPALPNPPRADGTEDWHTVSGEQGLECVIGAIRPRPLSAAEMEAMDRQPIRIMTTAAFDSASTETGTTPSGASADGPLLIVPSARRLSEFPAPKDSRQASGKPGDRSLGPTVSAVKDAAALGFQRQLTDRFSAFHGVVVPHE